MEGSMARLRFMRGVRGFRGQGSGGRGAAGGDHSLGFCGGVVE